jgi:hypothetical protein
MENTTFSTEEIKLMQILVDRAHTSNLENGMGNSSDMNSLLRKLSTLAEYSQDRYATILELGE